MKRQKKLFYSIKEVASLLSISKSTLYFWETQFPQYISPQRSPGGTRQYSESDIETIRLVKHLLQDKKLKIEGAEAELRQRKDALTLRSNTLARLQTLREQLVALEDMLALK